MRLKKAVLCAFALLTAALANTRVVYTVTAGGERLDGIYSAEQIDAALSGAEAAAAEIARSDAPAPPVAVRPSLSLSKADGDCLALTRELLVRTDGVATAWAVEVGGSAAGITADPSALGEVLETILAQKASDEAVSAEFDENITLRRVFVPEGQSDDLMVLARYIRDATQVMSVTADGAVRYG